MNLMSVPKPAVGLTYSGNFQSIMDLQAFVTQQGYTIQSMSFNSNSELLFDVSMSLFKQTDPDEPAIYSSLNARPNRIVVSPQNGTALLVLTQEQLESEYTVEE